jgi:putative flippase GtrA
MHALAVSLWRDTFVRYFAASLVALGVDASCFFALVALGVPAGPAAAAGYSVGIVAHWLLTSRAVFVSDLADRGPARTRQKALFVLSALAGLALTTAIVTGGAAIGANLALTKGVAVAVSFTANWLIRRWLVFRPHAAAA